MMCWPNGKLEALVSVEFEDDTVIKSTILSQRKCYLRLKVERPATALFITANHTLSVGWMSNILFCV